MEKQLAQQREFFQMGKTRTVAWRKQQLEQLKVALQEYEKPLLEALERDLGKCHLEGYVTELAMVHEEINTFLRKLKGWSKPKRVRAPLNQFPSKTWIIAEPLGLVLIIAPWNYPLQLTLSPMVAAIAAGNCVALKPSEYAQHTADIINQMLRRYFPAQLVTVYNGGIETSQQLLAQHFDHIFYTGSTKVGRIVMEAASKHLTPVTLELGGKSPCIVERTADISLAAKRIVWGKLLNCGQTCVAPDYILVHTDVKEPLIKAMAQAWHEFLGEHPLAHPDYGRIINQDHFQRLRNLMTMGKVVVGGEYCEETLQIGLTVLDQVRLDSPLMQEEIFGPILPVMNFEYIDDAISLIKRRPKPLALYLFTKDRELEKKLLEEISFGGGCINDTIVHLTCNRLPFGGVGASGMGAYHGKAGFDTFSHQKSILQKANWFDLPLRYPPYGDKLALIKKIMK